VDSLNSLGFLQTTRSVKKLVRDLAEPVVELADEPDEVDPPIVKKREY
jgi:hypothetical protein